MRAYTHSRTADCLLLVAAATTLALAAVQDASAWRSPPPGYWAGQRFRSMPRERVEIWAGGSAFYFSYGRYYRRGPSGFSLVVPPIGLIVPALPLGYVSFIIGGVTYYELNGVHYTRVPEGYRVVEYPVVVERQIIVEKPAAPAAPDSVHRITVQSELLNVRTGPGQDQEIITRVSRGKTLKVLGSIPEWYYVELDNGERGWVMMKFVTPFTPAPEPQG